jgi:hypothetical protein
MMHLLPNQFGYLTTTLRGERGEYDQSGTVGMFAVPSEHLTIALQLRPEGPWSPGYVTPDGPDRPRGIHLRCSCLWVHHDVAGLAMEVGAILGCNNLKAI